MSHFSGLDWAIVAVYLVGTMFAGIAVRKFVGKVEHFLVAGREMGLSLGIASLSATEFGIVTCMYMAQNGYDKGFSGAVVGILGAAAMLFIGLTGFCVKPLRDAGVITIPELLERRFGYGIRRLSGVVIILGGLLNMGVFLRMGGNFLVHVFGISGQAAARAAEAAASPSWMNALMAWAGAHYLELTMTGLLIAVATYTIMGGMLSVLVTDFLQFVVMSIGLLLVTVLILRDVGWGKLTATVMEHYGEGGFNPIAHPKMGWQYIGFNLLLQTAAMLTWQTKIQRLLAAKDSATSRRIYSASCFFTVCACLLPGLWGIAALATLPSGVVPASDTTVAMPMLLASIVPVGLMGILIASMLAAEMSTDSSYMLTWASVIYNDILSRKRKAKWTERKRLGANRILVGAIGLFLMFYGLWYEIKGDVWTYLGLTGTVYLSSMSALLIACCYWKRSNNWGALGAIICGAVFPVGFLVLQKVPATEAFAERLGPYIPGIAAYVAAGLAMVIGSYLKIAVKGEEAA